MLNRTDRNSRRSWRSVVLTAAGVAVLLTSACAAERPPYRTYHDAGFLYDNEDPTDPQLDCSAQELLPAPMLFSVPQTSDQLLQPIRGQLIGAQYIMAQGPGGSADPAWVASDGRFCLEVPLAANQANTITLTSRNSDGCPGQSTTITITQQGSTAVGSPPSPVTISGSANLARGAFSDARWNPSSGELRHVHDGDLQTSAQFSFSDYDFVDGLDESTWIRLDLGRVSNVHTIRMIWAQDAGSACASGFRVLTSAALAPGMPDPDNPEWVVVATHENDPCPATQEIPFSGVQARWVALMLYEDANTALFSAWFGQVEYFDLAEIEVLGRDPHTPAVGTNEDRCP